MNKIQFSLFPGGLNRCLTMSYDDGCAEDLRLAELFRTHGIKGTFHINTAWQNLSDPAYAAEFAKRYEGHEISCHTVTHPFPVDQPNVALLEEILENRRVLEKVSGYPVRGMSYPYGNYDNRVIAAYRAAGMEYSRTTLATNSFGVPEDFMLWHPTCHHSQDVMVRVEEFMKDQRYDRMLLFYVWGHAYEFPRANNWDLIEEFCEKMGGHDNIWYATNIEIVDYCNALKALRFSVNCDTVYNPTAIDVWFKSNEDTVFCPAGKTVSF